jgi:hypothetical protein
MQMTVNTSLEKLTEMMVSYNEIILNRFERARETGEKGDFYQEVKPFADEVSERTAEWRNEASAWLQKHPQRNLHPKQIDATAENIEMVCVQAFFPETSRKRFMGHVQSIEYVLQSLLDVLRK